MAHFRFTPFRSRRLFRTSWAQLADAERQRRLKGQSIFKLSDPRHLPKTATGSTLIGAPLLLLVGTILHPDWDPEGSVQLTIIGDNLDRWIVAHALWLTGLALTVVAVLGVMHMLREREPSYGRLGGTLALFGVVPIAGSLTIDGPTAWQIVRSGGNPVELAALLERVYDVAGVMFLIGLPLAVGLVVLAAGLYRARAIRWWGTAFVVIWAVLLAIESQTGNIALAAIAQAFLFLGLAPLGWVALTQPDQEWRHTPTSEGRRAR
jgi:hypothetical protein